MGKNIKSAEKFLDDLDITEFDYADKDEEKQKKGFCGKKVVPPENITKNEWILLTMPKTEDITDRLEQKGLCEIDDYFFLRKLDYYLFASDSAKGVWGKDIFEFGNHGCSFGVYCAGMGEKEKIIVYSFGIGQDVSFSEQLLEKYSQCEIFGFDPTPKSIAYTTAYIEHCSLFKRGKFTFFPIGLSNESGKKRFYLPKKAEHVSGSEICNEVVDMSNFIEVEMRTLQEIMEMLGHQSIDLLKMDIEGSEFAVIPQIVANHIKIGQICVEVHDRLIDQGRKKRIQLLEILRKNGYALVYVSDNGEELTFIKSE